MWMKQWGYEIAEKRSDVGIYRLRAGGYLIRVKAADPSGKQREMMRAIPEARLEDARRVRQELKDEIRNPKSKTLFASYAVREFKNRCATGIIKSLATRERWKEALEKHLIPRIGKIALEDMTLTDIKQMQSEISEAIEAGRYSPHTANGWLRILRAVVNAASIELRLPHNPCAGMLFFDTSTVRTYTPERPNALTAEWASKFVAEAWANHPQHVAMIVLGFVTGLRPSSLRPLRRGGPEPDVLWNQAKILVRRSNARGEAIMEKTKTGHDLELALPDEVMAILEWHVEQLIGAAAESVYLFPSRRTGGMVSRSVLDKPFRDISRRIGLPFKITPRGMRRTFNDLARLAGVSAVATKAISGHHTTAMHLHYQTIQPAEMRLEMGKVAGLLSAARLPSEGVKLGGKPVSDRAGFS